MAKSCKEIVTDIENYIKEHGGKHSDYYCGITNDVERRLFGEHNVDEKHGIWIYRTASSDNVAREVEKHFLDNGYKGGTGGGNNDCKIVYCYKITITTVE